MSSTLHHLLAGLALLFAVSAQATEIYRWIDETGRTHVADVVPEKYRKSAIRIDSSQSEVSPEQRQQAERAAARNKVLAEEAAKRSQKPPVRASVSASRPATVKRPVQGVTESTDCETWLRLYRESVECFAPFRTTRGATRAEAFEKCNPIASPELKCGVARE